MRHAANNLVTNTRSCSLSGVLHQDQAIFISDLLQLDDVRWMSIDVNRQYCFCARGNLSSYILRIHREGPGIDVSKDGNGIHMQYTGYTG